MGPDSRAVFSVTDLLFEAPTIEFSILIYSLRWGIPLQAHLEAFGPVKGFFCFVWEAT